ncbi:MAG: phage tail family protein [Bacillus sp. (in: firmicutes)]|uniref:distal tail protein Dit n=1 Tax=Bacillus sp. TaxID=1409 RepID=UPI002E2343CB|nr:phage tail family protein [Bacillus thuringiensis]
MIVLDGIPAEQLGIHVLKDYVDPSIPATRDSGVVIPGKHGEIDFGAYLGNREFNIPIVLIPQSSYYEALEKTDELKKILIDSHGKPRTFKLVVGDRPDRYYNVRYSGALPINDLIKNRFFTLSLTAYDPHAYSIVESTEDVLWGDDVPFMSDIPFGIGDSSYVITTPQTLNIDNFGSQVIRPIIEISGSATSLTLTVQGESFSLGTFSNSTILIDAERYAAIKNGQNFLFQLQGNLEKLEFMPGANAIQIGGSNLNINITFKYRAKYI